MNPVLECARERTEAAGLYDAEVSWCGVRAGGRLSCSLRLAASNVIGTSITAVYPAVIKVAPEALARHCRGTAAAVQSAPVRLPLAIANPSNWSIWLVETLPKP